MKAKNILKYLASAAFVLDINASENYTVDELILLSLKNSPDLQISQANYEASQSRYDKAFSAYLPEVNLHASAGKIGMSDIFNSSSNKTVDDNLILGSLSLKQIIYDFGQTGGNADNFKYQSESYLMENLQDISNKKRDTKTAYYDVLKALALIVVQKENVKLNEAQLYRSKKYFEAGIRTKIDISDAKVSLIQSKLDLKKSEYDLKEAYANLDKVVGFTQLERDYDVYSEDLDLSSVYDSLTEYRFNLEEAILYAYENRAELKKFKSDISAKEAQVHQAQSQYYPSLYLAADYTKQELDTLRNLQPENSWQATLNADWNLYAGGSTMAQTQEKKIQTDISNYSYTYSKLSIKKETTDAYINVNRAKDSVELAQSLVEVSSEKFDQASKRYEHGLSDYIELQQSRQDYIDAKATLVVAYYDYYTAVANLDNAIGN